jgi:CubicO group peptidase (beta-lactamase class C family)
MSTAAGLSRARLVRMHVVMDGYVERGEVPGLVTLVNRRGEVHVDVIGTQAFADPTPMRRDTIFRISSMTKPIIAAATMILVEECTLRLDEPVDALLPVLAERRVLKRLDGPLDDTVPAKRPITVRDLLTFRMGFGQIMAPPDAYPILSAANELQIGMPPPDEWMRRLGGLPLMHQPDERWMYNTVLSELKQHLGTESCFCFPSPDKRLRREAETNALSLLRSIHDQEASEENGTWLCSLLLPNVPTYLS